MLPPGSSSMAVFGELRKKYDFDKRLDSGGGGGSYFLGANDAGTCSAPTHPAITQIMRTDGFFYFLQGTRNLSAGVWS
jgi:hypothetical protein